MYKYALRVSVEIAYSVQTKIYHRMKKCRVGWLHRSPDD